MTIQEMYEDAITHEYYWLEITIEFLVKEKQVLGMNDNAERITYFLQDKFSSKMNEHLEKYERERQYAKH
ncbi:hypothetical protein KYJ26_20320 [Bacillus sp. MCCB 382]|uniref:hypothetical protein n=1 Tax=Bacillus sp. MCCB 382 TaxID=2860197 RepID=UPI001C559EA7|nr:hypothetical protein [Bacillus sp. MCCB 382]